MLKAIVFDFDGVIVDSEPLHYRAFLRVAAAQGIEFSYQTYLDEYIGFDDRDAFRAMLRGHRRSDGDAAVLPMVAAKADAFEAVVAEGIETIPGVERLIAQAAAAMPVAIASGATRRDIDLVLARIGLAGRFAPIISADMVARSKPHPASYALAVQGLAKLHPALGIRPAECLAIEDTAAGVESARAAGLVTLGLATTGQADRLAAARRVVKSLDQVGLAQLRAWFDE